MKSLKNSMMRAAMTLLAVLTTTTMAAWNAQPPVYNIEFCKGGIGEVCIGGWVYDPYHGDLDIFISVFNSLDENHRVMVTSEYYPDCIERIYREDVNNQHNLTGNHGFRARIPIESIFFGLDLVETWYVKIYVRTSDYDPDSPYCEEFEYQLNSPYTAVNVVNNSGYGTEEFPYLIYNATHWDAIADVLADADTAPFYANKYFQLFDDHDFSGEEYDNSTPVTKTWGTYRSPFTGHFDGKGQTLNVNISSTDGFVAPFAYVSGATIQDLTVSGTINGSMYMGGIVGYAAGTLSVERCIFDGTISGFKYFAGGLVGWCEDMTLNLQNSLFKGSFSPGSGGKYHPIAIKNAGATVTASAAVGVYYLNTVIPSARLGDNVVIGARGFPVSTTLVADIWDEPVTAIDGQTYYTCETPPPVNLMTFDITEYTALLSWEDTPSGYPLTGNAYQYKKSSDAEWSAESIVTGTSAAIDGLSANTDYQFRVKALYGKHGESIYATGNFTTAMGLPYECGFENGMNRWRRLDINWGYTEINKKAARDGENGFVFNCGENVQYLISPQFAGADGIVVSFYYRQRFANSNHPLFQVGYSTTTSDPSAFTWDAEITATGEWTLYEKIFPAGTRYVAVRYNSVAANGYTADELYLDDFLFVRNSPYSKPTGLAVSNLTDHSAKLTWTAPNGATRYAYQYKKPNDSVWSTEATVNTTSVTLDGLEANTNYEFRVKALYAGDNASNYVTARFLTEASAVTSLPLTEGFENGMGGWRIEGSDGRSGLTSTQSNVHDGSYSFQFYVANNNLLQYLVSPQIDVTGSIKFSFYYQGYSAGHGASFCVGYSTNTKNPADFHFDASIKSSSDWQKYSMLCPEGTKYVAIIWVGGNHLRIDDITIESTSVTPTQLQDIAVTDVTATSAEITWTGGAEEFEVNFREKAHFIEDFEGGFDQQGWEGSDIGGDLISNGYFTSWQYQRTDGNQMAASINYYQDLNDNGEVTGIGVWKIDDWLISPKMPLSGTLTFLAHFESENFNELTDTCEVRVSTVSQPIINFIINPSTAPTLCSIDVTPTIGKPQYYSCSLDSFNGEEGVILFRHKSEHKSKLLIDDVCLYRTTDEFTTLSTTEHNKLLTGLRPQTGYEYQVRTLSGASRWSDLQSFTTDDFIPLANMADINATANGHRHDVILQGLTLHRDRNWNTLCVPFNVNDFSGTPLEGTIVKKLESSDFSDDILTLNFTDATNIEAGKPYIVKWEDKGADLVINNIDEWESFAKRVNNGETFAGKHVILGGDIPFPYTYTESTLAGTADHPFCGTFDGNGYTIDLNINSSEIDYAAPFRYINGATIQNVKVTGSVSGGPYCAGIVGAALGGTNLIRNCWVAASVTSTGNTIGGVLGHSTTSTTTILCCYVDGNLKATGIGIFCGGGNAGGTCTINTCRTLGSYNYDSGSGGLTLVKTNGGTVNVINCYHNNQDIPQGEFGIIYIQPGSSTTLGSRLATFFGNHWTVDDGGELTLKPSSEMFATNLENPLFYGVTVRNDAPTPDTYPEGQFVGTYSPFYNLNNLNNILFDASNADNGAFHAAIVTNPSNVGDDFEGWFNDAEMTVPAAFIPFDANGDVTLHAGWWVELADDSDNTGTIESVIASGKTNHKVVVINGRTLYRDNEWNTLCLPFDMDATQISVSPLADATVMELDGSTSDLTDGTLRLNFKDATSIQAGKPYIVKWPNGTKLFINSDADWTAFAQRVAAGETFAGKNVLLTADINVSTMVGTADNPFRGTFNGAGHTLNLSIDASGVEYAAPFRYISDANIRNLKVTGSVNGGSHCAGIVGAALGETNSIRDCWMAASLTSIGNTIGGVLGHSTTSSTTILSCLLDGDLAATGIGIFCGGGDTGGTCTLNTCRTIGTYHYDAVSGGLTLVKTNGGTVNIINSYHNNQDIPQGVFEIIWNNTGGFDRQLATFLGNQWTVDGNEKLVLVQSNEFDTTDIQDPVFMGVTVSSDDPTPVTFTGGSFRGSYNPVALTTSDFLIDANSTLYHPDADMTLNACRGYFQLSDPNATVNTIVLNFGDVEILLGDVNGDGTVSPADAIMILYHYFNVEQNGFNAAAADMNGDSYITPADAIEALYKFFNSGQSHAPRKGQQEREPQ